MLQNYVKIAWRALWAQRTYTVLNVIGLAVSAAGALLLFLFIRYHVSTDRHHAKFDRIYRVVTDLHLDDGSVEYDPEAPLPMAQVLRTAYPQVEQAAFLRMLRSVTVSVRTPGRPIPAHFLEQEGAVLAEGGLFQIFDYHWLSGNPQTALRAPNSAVLTRSWARRYFGTQNPLGQLLELDHQVNVTVTGVIADPPYPTDLSFGLFISLPTVRQLDPEYDVRDWAWLNSTDRLYLTLRNAEPSTAAQVASTFPALARTRYGAMANAYHFQLQPLAEVHFDVQRTGGVIRWSLLGGLVLIGLFLLLTACVNFVNLATAQAFRRGKEVGVRKTLGSSRGQLVGQFLLETALIVALAMLLALVLVGISLPLFQRWVGVPLALSLDVPTGLFIGLVLILLIGLAGGYPAAVLAGFSPVAALRRMSLPGTGAASGKGLRQGLVVFQFVVCQTFLIGALVVLNQLHFIRRADLGFRPDDILVVPLPYQKQSSWPTFKKEISRHSGVRSVTLQYRPPSAQVLNGGSVKFGGSAEWLKFPVRERLADADYLKTYDFRLLAGRNVTESDSIREYVINETLLHKLGYRRPEAILGQSLQYYLSPIPLPIVGVVRDFHQRSLHESIAPCLITTYPRMYRQAGIRLSGTHSAQTLAHIRAVWQRLYPNEVFSAELLTDQLARLYETEATISRLVNAFVLMVMLICGLGLYGLVALMVGQRTKEIGIRKVLGASVTSIVALLSKDFLKLVLLAVGLATPLAGYLAQRWLQGFAYRIELAYGLFALAGLLATSVALLTVGVQSLKAARMNPVKSLRSD
jgi:putative ABC transport system permease protein